MTLVLLALMTALVVAVAFRGRISTFVRPGLQRLGLLGIVVIALLTSVLAKSAGVFAGWTIIAALAVGWFLAVNRGRPGLGLVVAGLGLNALVIILNGGMPVSMEAVTRAGVPLDRVPLATDPLREQLTTETVAPWLGEAVPLALPIRPSVASTGDVLLAAGVALFVFTGLTGLGRTVPERALTREERKAQRLERKAARAAEAEPDVAPVAARASRVIDEPAIGAGRAEVLENRPAAPVRAQPTPAAPVRVQATLAAPVPAQPRARAVAAPPAAADSATAAAAGSATAAATGPAAKAAEEAQEDLTRKQVKRQKKKLRKKRQKRRAAQGTDEPTSPPTEVGAVSSEGVSTGGAGRS